MEKKNFTPGALILTPEVEATIAKTPLRQYLALGLVLYSNLSLQDAFWMIVEKTMMFLEAGRLATAELQTAIARASPWYQESILLPTLTLSEHVETCRLTVWDDMPLENSLGLSNEAVGGAMESDTSNWQRAEEEDELASNISRPVSSQEAASSTDGVREHSRWRDREQQRQCKRCRNRIERFAENVLSIGVAFQS